MIVSGRGDKIQFVCKVPRDRSSLDKHELLLAVKPLPADGFSQHPLVPPLRRHASPDVLS